MATTRPARPLPGRRVRVAGRARDGSDRLVVPLTMRPNVLTIRVPVPRGSPTAHRSERPVPVDRPPQLPSRVIDGRPPDL